MDVKNRRSGVLQDPAFKSGNNKKLQVAPTSNKKSQRMRSGNENIFMGFVEKLLKLSDQEKNLQKIKAEKLLKYGEEVEQIMGFCLGKRIV